MIHSPSSSSFAAAAQGFELEARRPGFNLASRPAAAPPVPQRRCCLSVALPGRTRAASVLRPRGPTQRLGPALPPPDFHACFSGPMRGRALWPCSCRRGPRSEAVRNHALSALASRSTACQRPRCGHVTTHRRPASRPVCIGHVPALVRAVVAGVNFGHVLAGGDAGGYVRVCEGGWGRNLPLAALLTRSICRRAKRTW